MLEAALNTVRALAAIVGLLNAFWSARGAIELARGIVSPPSLYLSSIFWIAVGVIGFQINHFEGSNDTWRLLSFVTLLLGMALAAVGHRMGSGMRARQFYSLYDHLDVALAIVTLAREDAAAAERMADACRQHAAAAILARDG